MEVFTVCVYPGDFGPAKVQGFLPQRDVQKVRRNHAGAGVAVIVITIAQHGPIRARARIGVNRLTKLFALYLRDKIAQTGFDIEARMIA